MSLILTDKCPQLQLRAQMGRKMSIPRFLGLAKFRAKEVGVRDTSGAGNKARRRAGTVRATFLFVVLLAHVTQK